MSDAKPPKEDCEEPGKRRLTVVVFSGTSAWVLAWIAVGRFPASLVPAWLPSRSAVATIAAATGALWMAVGEFRSGRPGRTYRVTDAISDCLFVMVASSMFVIAFSIVDLALMPPLLDLGVGGWLALVAGAGVLRRIAEELLPEESTGFQITEAVSRFVLAAYAASHSFPLLKPVTQTPWAVYTATFAFAIVFALTSRNLRKYAFAAAGAIALAVIVVRFVPSIRAETDWQWAQHSGWPGAYRRYVDRWPKGRHVAEASALLDTMEWRGVPRDDARALEWYIASHPDSPFVRQAQKSLEATLRDEALRRDRERKSRDESDWTSAKNWGTELGHEQYLRDHPDGAHVAEAKRGLAAAKAKAAREAAEEQRQAASVRRAVDTFDQETLRRVARSDRATEALIHAAYNDTHNSLALLLEAGADIYDALAEAARYKESAKIAGTLIRHDRIRSADAYARVFRQAVWQENDELASLLLEQTHIDSRIDDKTALMQAAEAGNRRAVAWLVSRDASVDAATSDGTTALMMALRSAHQDVVDALLDAGADANASDRDGVTPLMLAAQSGNRELVERLISKGADVARQDDRGRTAAEHALENHHLDLAQALGWTPRRP
ncbi:MAG: ankyrin repeat domain-containing protein [Thermoanaerobaculia bacterium]